MKLRRLITALLSLILSYGHLGFAQTVDANLVRNINFSADSDPSQLVNINGTAFFGADNGINGNELWKSDGTPAGTVLVKDINPGLISSSIRNLTNVNGTLFFTTSDGTNGWH